MGKTLRWTLDISALVIIAAIAALIAYYLRDAEFEIHNETSEVVTVAASWADQKKYLGAIQPSSMHSFSIDAEAAMKFSVRYGNGRKAESEQIYFTGGTKVVATISLHGIALRYDFEN